MTTTLRGNFKNLSSWDAQFLHPEAVTVSDTVREAMPSPLTWNVGFAAYWAAFSVANDNYPAGVGPLTARSNWNGATLITRRHVVVADHSPPSDGAGAGTIWWLQTDGTEIHRERATLTNIGDDLSVITLDSPITTITPMAICADSSQLAGQYCALVEVNRHVNLMRLPSGHSNTTDYSTPIRYGVTQPDEVESGDSGKPGITVFADQAILSLTALYGASSGGSAGAYYSSGNGPNPSHYLAALTALVEADGESLTLVTLAITSNFTSAALSAGCSAALSATQYHPALIGN